MTEISERARQLGTENAFAVLSNIETLRKQGRDIISFCIGQPDFPTPEHACNAAITAMHEGNTGYTESAGIAGLRKAVAAHVSRSRHINVEEDEVVCGAGAKPFIEYTIQAVTDYGQGHEVIYPVPGFPVYENQVSHQGAVAVPLSVPARPDEKRELDELESRINDNTRLLIINSPHNPSGRVYSRRFLEAIAEMIRNRESIWVLSDEPYSAFVYDDDFASIASVRGMQERTVIVDSVSKTYSMTGWRVGYAVNSLLADVFSRMVTNTSSCSAHPNQYAAIAALSGPQESVDEMRRVFKARRDHIVSSLNKLEGVECLVPAGAFYAWPDVTGLCKTLNIPGSAALARRLLQEAGVAVLADAHFCKPGDAGRQHLRFSYACSMEDIDRGIERIGRFISDAKQKR